MDTDVYMPVGRCDLSYGLTLTSAFLLPWCSGPHSWVAHCPETGLFVGLIIPPARWVKSSLFSQSRPEETRTEGSSVTESKEALVAGLQ